MERLTTVPLSARALRMEVGARNLDRRPEQEREVTYGRLPNVVYVPNEDGSHGNFLPASLRRILATPSWAARLEKAYTASARLPHAQGRRRGELECANSSDALLMNVFCYPGVLNRSAVCTRLGVQLGQRPAFGVRAELPMHRAEIDRTEWDMVLGDLLLEAKLTEGGFGTASAERISRYPAIAELFDLQGLPRTGKQFAGYQIVRGLAAAVQGGRRYAVLVDARRADLQEICYRVVSQVRCAEAASRFRLLTWQELATALPPVLRVFLAEKYGIHAE